jgi:rubrerythrin
MNDNDGMDPQDLSEDNERSEFIEEGEWTCDVCGGPMYSAAHWNYGQCDDCGAKQELINDDYI